MAEYRTLKKDEVLFNLGDTSDYVYFVQSGQVLISASDGTQQINLAVLGAGELLGELALFDRQTRCTNARALCETVVMKLPYDQLQKQINDLPVWIQLMFGKLAEKLRMTNKLFFD